MHRSTSPCFLSTLGSSPRLCIQNKVSAQCSCHYHPPDLRMTTLVHEFVRFLSRHPSYHHISPMPDMKLGVLILRCIDHASVYPLARNITSTRQRDEPSTNSRKHPVNFHHPAVQVSDPAYTACKHARDWLHAPLQLIYTYEHCQSRKYHHLVRRYRDLSIAKLLHVFRLR